MPVATCFLHSKVFTSKKNVKKKFTACAHYVFLFHFFIIAIILTVEDARSDPTCPSDMSLLVFLMHRCGSTW